MKVLLIGGTGTISSAITRLLVKKGYDTYILNYLFIKNSKVLLFIFRATCLVAIFLGAQADFGLVWNIADITMGLMAIVNIIAIFLLSKVAFKVLAHYEEKKKQGENPVFYEDEVGLTGTVWKRGK